MLQLRSTCITYKLSRLLALVIPIFLGGACSDQYNNGTEVMGTQRYKEAVFATINVAQNINYGQASTQGGITQNLLMDIYQPQGDTLAQRPLVILIHGGGFVGGSKEEFVELGRLLAQSGYVAASISYRLIDIERTESTLRQGILEAVYDTRAALRFFKKDAAQSNTYRVDTNNIFVSGYSAGAFTALHTAYINTLGEIETLGDSSLLRYANTQGGLAGNSGNPGFSASFKGVVNIAGALISTSLVDAQEPILLSFHGTEDGVVPYLEGESDGSGLITQGSALIHPVANQLGITNQLIAIQGGDHGAFFACESCESDLLEFLFANL